MVLTPSLPSIAPSIRKAEIDGRLYYFAHVRPARSVQVQVWPRLKKKHMRSHYRYFIAVTSTARASSSTVCWAEKLEN